MKFTVVICSLFCVVISSTVCFARVEFSPRLTLSEEYNDNIFLQPIDEESDYITTVAPGLGAAFEMDPLNLYLDYSLEYRKYQDHQEEDETNLRDIQRGLILAQLLPGRDFNLDLTQEFSNVPIDTRLPSSEANARVNRTNLSRFVVRPRYHHLLTPTLGLYLDYQYENWRYQSPQGDDLEGQSVQLGVIKKLSPRLSVLVGGQGGVFNARFTPDYDVAAAYGGVSVRPLPSLTIDVVAGQAWLDFEGDADEETLIGDVLARLALGEKLSTGVGYSEDFFSATDLGLYQRKRARLLVGWNNPDERYTGAGLYSWRRNYPDPGQDQLSRLLAGEGSTRSFWELSLYSQREDYYSVNRDDRETGTELSTRLQLTSSWDLLAGGQLAELKLRPEQETVKRYTADLGIEYQFRFLTLGLHYFYREDDSDNDNNDFRNNIGFLQVGLGF